MSGPNLRAVPDAGGCPGCERLRRQLDETAMELVQAEQDLKKMRRRLAVKERDDRNALKAKPKYELAEKLFEYWKEQCGHPRAVLGPKRERALLARLEQYEPRQIAQAIRGAAVAAFVDPQGVRHDDLELICRDEVKLESFIERYHKWKESR